MTKKLKEKLSVIGPGIVIAATGLGAGDMVAAAVGGANYGLTLIWAVIIGAILKYYLNLGLAKWQLFRGSTLIGGWHKHMHFIFLWYFLVYLVLWSFIVSGALMSATGLAAYSLFKNPGVPFWGIIHAFIAFAIVYFNKYKVLEQIMKFFIALMFIAVIISAILMKPDMANLVQSVFQFHVPDGSVKIILGIIGGVGGSVTLLSYGYWIKEKGWNTKNDIKKVRIDLIVAYTLTALFGISILIIASKIGKTDIKGNDLIILIGDELEKVSGNGGKYIFLIGFWGAVFSSLIGVFQGVPYLFEDVYLKLFPAKTNQTSGIQNKLYKGFLLFLFIPPISLLFITKPVWMVLVYSVVGAFFMPFLAFTLLWLLNRKEIRYKQWHLNLFLIISLILFIVLMIIEFSK